MHGALEQVMLELGGPVTPERLPDAERILERRDGGAPAATRARAAPSAASRRGRSIAADLRRYLR